MIEDLIVNPKAMNYKKRNSLFIKKEKRSNRRSWMIKEIIGPTNKLVRIKSKINLNQSIKNGNVIEFTMPVMSKSSGLTWIDYGNRKMKID